MTGDFNGRLVWRPQSQIMFQHVNCDHSMNYDQMREYQHQLASVGLDRVASPRAWLHKFVASTCDKGRELYA